MKKTTYSKKIVLIGAGNVATHLGMALYKANCEIIQVLSRSGISAKLLAKKLNSEYSSNLNELKPDADIYIIAVKDDAIADVIRQIKIQPNLIVHTSGTCDSALFLKKFKNYGVLYPLQTFSIKKQIDFAEVPIFIEANTTKNLKNIEQLALLLSDKVIKANAEKRKAVHIAAVFACNFSNHMYAVAEQILKNEKIPFSILQPLIQETAQKVKENSPQKMQTGPAIRNDLNVLKAHLKYLNKSLVNKKIYTLVSQSILDFSKKDGAKS